VSIEDIVEEIVGNIHDEYDTEEEEVQRVGDDVYEVSGGVSINEIADDFDIDDDDFDDDDFDTIGGFVLKHLGRLPIEGDVVEASGLRVNVLKVERHRVARVRIARIGDEIQSDQEEHGPIEESE
jgi:CBS domain containing-hemolysin-like protein